MKTKFIYVILAVLLMGSQMTLSAQNTDNKQKKQRPTPCLLYTSPSPRD